MDRCYADVVAVLQTYFDGLHHSDTGRLRQVFHPRAHYVTATAGAADGAAPLHLTMAEYFPIVTARPSPASRAAARNDTLFPIEFPGQVTSITRRDYSLVPQFFPKLL